mgnify:CR=1 FL=1
MADAETLIPSFIHVHDDHHGKLRVVQEGEPEAWEYREHLGTEKPPDDDEVDLA